MSIMSTFLRAHSSASAENWCDPTKTWWIGLKAPYHRTSMIVISGSRCGPNPWQQHHHKARDALRSATKGERTFTSIWDRWQSDEIYRKFQLPHYRWDTWDRYLDNIAHFDMYDNACKGRANDMWFCLFTKFLTRSSRQDHYGKDQRTEKRERNCQIFSSQQEKNKLLIFKQVIGSVNRTDSTLHYRSTWNGWAWIGLKNLKNCTIQNAHHLQAGHHMVEFIWSWQKWHAHGWHDDKWSDQW